MHVFLKLLRFVNDWLEKIVMVVTPCLVAFSVLVLFGGALTRYFTGTGFTVFQELPPMLMPWLVFPVAGCLLRTGGHITVDFLPDMVGERGNRILRVVGSLIVVAAGITFIVAGLKAVALFRMMGQMTEMEFSFPIWWIYLSFPVGFAMLVSFALENLLAALLGERSGLRGPEADARAMRE
jgi:TRAP-type C4-dicarboxylate transport system permease small subunit